jgi:hypothetical protein
MIRLLLCTLALVAGSLSADPLKIQLPTENRHLFTGELDKFYMYVDRTFEGQTSKPWEGGSFGYVRTPIRIGSEVVLTKFHEGIDIAPVKRDRAGNPLDLVTSIADGTVVHVSNYAGQSNYGKYLVVEHRWNESAIYSLYAHLAEITCSRGDSVKIGGVLGRMGYTGAGINRTRAHLHLEVAFLMSHRYESWHRARSGGVNHHGIFNGMNLSGVDVGLLFTQHNTDPTLDFKRFIGSIPVQFKVSVPSAGVPDFLIRHPWMLAGESTEAESWEISFSATGHPIAFAASSRRVDAPVITQIRPSSIPHRHLTRGLVTGEGNRASLTAAGKNLVALLMDDFPDALP